MDYTNKIMLLIFILLKFQNLFFYNLIKVWVHIKKLKCIKYFIFIKKKEINANDK